MRTKHTEKRSVLEPKTAFHGGMTPTCPVCDLGRPLLEVGASCPTGCYVIEYAPAPRRAV